MALSAWVLGALILELHHTLVGLGGIVILLLTLVAMRRIAPLLDDWLD